EDAEGLQVRLGSGAPRLPAVRRPHRDRPPRHRRDGVAHRRPRRRQRGVPGDGGRRSHPERDHQVLTLDRLTVGPTIVGQAVGGMWPGKHALERPDQAAFVMAATGETVTYRELNDRSNQLAQCFFDAGLRFGDHIAVFMENRRKFFEVCWAAQRSGLYYTCINWHFNADETAYILDDCDAQVLVISDTFRDLATDLLPKMLNVKLRRMVGTPVDGYESYEATRDRFPAEPLEEELEGTRMLYSSGTTGRPKGVRYKIPRQRIGDQPVEMGMMTAVWGMDGEAIYLSPAPLYHSAPLFYSMSTMRLGGTVITMEHFDPEQCLALIEQYGVTHSQWVPTMFVRMLKLPDDVRAEYDLSSHKVVLHAAAPCSVETKRKMIEWWGPIIDEYYAATEGTGATYINSADWLAHPGSVGRS